MSQSCDVIVIGAGSAGLMCAASAGYRGRSVLVLDNAKKAGRKVLISGGGRCNFTNNELSTDAFICANPHFVKSALSRYTAWNFLDMVERNGVAVSYPNLTLSTSDLVTALLDTVTCQTRHTQ